VNVSAGTSSADNTGLNGAIGMTYLDKGVVKATIEDGAKIDANNLTVNSAKDDDFINTIIAFSQGQDSYSYGLSGIILTDSVESYIGKAIINSLGSVDVNADYNKTIVNANVNIGISSEGKTTPSYKAYGEQTADVSGFQDLFNSNTYDAPTFKWYNIIKKYKAKSEKIKDIAARTNSKYDYLSFADPDKKTKSYAGGINLNYVGNAVKAYIKDGANISAEKDVTVNALSKDYTVDTAAVTSVKGKSGGGSTILADISVNDVEASIGKAVVDAKGNLSVSANEDYGLVAASVGVANEKDDSGVGNLSSAVQSNNITAAIKDGALINTNETNSNQTVSVDAGVKSNVIKAVGALSVQAGFTSSQDGGKSVGATVDGDVVSNTINAYIKDSTVNAGKLVSVKATNEDSF
jgi:hypothetical protein